VSEALVVPTALEGERLDRALALLTGLSRSDVARLCEAGEVLVEGRPAAKSRRLLSGETVELLAEPAAEEPPAAEDIPVDVLHVDDDVLVVDKPAGLVVHPGAGHRAGTLVNGLLARFPELASVGDPARPGIVHRLDRETSGLMVVARSPAGYEGLVGALASRAIERRYVALVWGRLDATRGVIDAPVGRSTARRTRMAVRAGGREARTAYEVRCEYDDPVVSLLECRLETGRTHQIRVHLAAIGHPVVGDAAYGGQRDSLPLRRPFLHAAALAFAHPVTGGALRFEAPVPPELDEVRRDLDARRGTG
jgi:23S rRNA pseudouridine1911/1915/1917 synthase